MAGTGKKCGASYIPKTATCNKGRGVRAAVGITAGAVVVGAVSSQKARAQMGTIPMKSKLYVQNKVAGALQKAGLGATPAKPSMKFSGPNFSRKLRRQNHLNNARLMIQKMRRKHEPGYRNSKKPFWADGFEGELQAGLFHMDKKCGASGIPDNANSKLSKKDSMDLTPATLRGDACWKGYVQAGTKRKGNRTVPNCIPAGKRKAKLKKAGLDGEDKLTSAKRTVWAEGFEPKKTKARR